VTDGEQRAALALVRSLGQGGHQVFVCSCTGRSLAGASRHAAAEFPVADPLANPERFSSEVSALVERLHIGLIIPVSEGALLSLLDSPLAHRGLIPFPSFERVKAICDKAGVLGAAAEVGIAIPRQLTLQTPEDATRLDPSSIGFPLVIKPSRSVSDQGAERIKLGVLYAADQQQLSQALAGLPRAAYPLLLQQRVIGDGVGVFLLLWDGAVIAQFSHRRIREKPPSGGVSVYRESIAADPGLVARSRALLERFDWQGVAMVEYKRDAATGTPVLMEINGRFWGSLQLAIDSGVDFPRLLVAVAGGQKPAPVLNYRLGIRSRWWWGDVDHLVAVLRRSPSRLHLPPGTPGRLKTVMEFLKLWRPGDRNETLRWSDPRPFLRETFLWLKRS
jgi:predicted ATP-grasp superfamily ATP-dependent carboligase